MDKGRIVHNQFMDLPLAIYWEFMIQITTNPAL